MPDEITPPFDCYECTLGTVTGYSLWGDGPAQAYLITSHSGQNIGIRAQGVPSPENVEADIAALSE